MGGGEPSPPPDGKGLRILLVIYLCIIAIIVATVNALAAV